MRETYQSSFVWFGSSTQIKCTAEKSQAPLATEVYACTMSFALLTLDKKMPVARNLTDNRQVFISVSSSIRDVN